MGIKAVNNGKVTLTDSGKWLFAGPFTAAGSFEEQVETSLNAAFAALSALNIRPSSIVKADVIVTDIEKSDIVIESYRKAAGDELPVMRIVEEEALPDGSLFSVELTACPAAEISRFYLEGDVPCAVRADDFVFTAIAYPDAPGSIETEAAQAVAKLLAAGAMAGAKPENFVKNFVHLTDCGNFGAFNAVYAATFTAVPAPPARSLHGVKTLPGGFSAGVEGIAYLGLDKETVRLGEEAGDLPFCKAMKAGGLLFVSGQVGLVSPAGGYNLDIASQIPCMLGILDAIANAGGVKPEQYLKVTTFARNVSDREKYMGAYAAQYGSIASNVSFYQVTGLAHPAILIESDIIAEY